MCSKAVTILFALFLSLTTAQLTTTRTIQSVIKNNYKVPPIIYPGNTNTYPSLDLSITCPCGCGSPTNCRGPLLNALNIEPICQCGKSGCQCNLAAYYGPELPVSYKPTNFLESVGFPYDVKACSCFGPCQCQRGPVCAIPNAALSKYTPINSEAYFTPNLPLYPILNQIPTYESVELRDYQNTAFYDCPNQLISYEFIAPVQIVSVPSVRLCGCGNNDCGCQNACGCPVNACTCPKNICGCPINACMCPTNACGCPQNKCRCLRNTCGCPQNECRCLRNTCGCPQNECRCLRNTCGCPQNECRCLRNACGCPQNLCRCPKNVCECPDICECFENSLRSVAFLELLNNNIIELSCNYCGSSSCDCPMLPFAPVMGSGKYLRQVTIQPPFL